MKDFYHIDRLDLRGRRVQICDRENQSEFAVLAPIVKKNNKNYLLFQIRSERLNRQPNEICFPGGKIEPGESAGTAALRETSEELLIPLKKIRLSGELDTVVTPFSSIIYPFVGFLEDYHDTFNHGEVKEIFYVPLSFFMENEPSLSYADVHVVPPEDFPFHLIQKGKDYSWAKGRYPTYFYIYEDKIIWGITARIVANLVHILKDMG